jgi:hypothetical protein
MRTHLRTSLVVIAVLLLGLPAAAHATAEDAIRDCADDGVLNKHYSHKDLQTALDMLPSDANEYSDCASVLQRALAGGNGNTGGAPPNGIFTPSGAIAGSPDDVQALSKLAATAAKGKRPSVSVGAAKVVPGNAGLGGVLGGLAGANGMPTSLVVTIAALLILAVITAYLAAREKIPLVRRVALRVFRR